MGLQATFENPEQLLRPGMFARVEVLLPEEQAVLVIPATSVLSAPYGDSVYVIESKPGKDGGQSELVVRQQFIRTGQRARRLCERRIGAQGRRAHCQFRHLQAAQRHVRDREQRPVAKERAGASAARNLISPPRP